MLNLSLYKITALAGLVGSVTILGACTEAEDLRIINSCYQDVVVGEHYPEFDEWHSIDDGAELSLHAGSGESMFLTVLPAGAEQVADPVEVKLDELEWEEGLFAGRSAELDLGNAGRCPAGPFASNVAPDADASRD